MRRSEQSVPFVYRLQIELVASLFVILGMGLVFALGSSVWNNPRLQIGDLEFERVVWRFLQNFGILRPILILAAAGLLLRLGLKLRTGYIGAARWAKSILIWLLIIIGVVCIQAFFVGLDADLTHPGSIGNGLSAIFPWVLLLLVFGAAYIMIGSSRAFYTGEESIEEQTTRNAWNLLVPALAIFIVIAISPLEQVFFSSLTDERFASSEISQFVGLDNYAQLLGLRIDRLDCETNPDDGTCLTETRNGVTSIVYPNPRGVLGDEYRELRFREWTSFDFNGVHYVVSARDREFIESAITSIIYTAVSIFLQLVLGMFIAMILAARIRGGNYLRLAMLVPLAIPTLIATQFWDVMFTENASGMINSLLLSLNIIQEPQAWLLNPNLQIPAVVLVIVWKETPTMALLLLPGLLAISKEVYEAAQVDGLNRVQRFLRITLPLMRPTIGVALVLRTMVTLRVFDVFDILLGRLRFSMATYAYETLTLRQQYGYSSAISVTIFLIIMVFTIIYVRTLRIDES